MKNELEVQILEIQQAANDLWDSLERILHQCQIEYIEKVHEKDLEKLGIL